MKIFSIFFLCGSLSAATTGPYKSFLGYDHSDINRIRTVTFEPAKNLQKIALDKECIGSIYEDSNRVIIAFTGSPPNSGSTGAFNLGNICGQVEECYEGAIKKITEHVNLEKYARHEVVVTGSRSCAKLALLFAASQLNFSVPHQHKVVLFGIPVFSDTFIYKSISTKIKYKGDVLMFDYYSLLPRNVSTYPGLLIEMTPRSYRLDAWRNNFFTKGATFIEILGGISSLYFLIFGGTKEFYQICTYGGEYLFSILKNNSTNTQYLHQQRTLLTYSRFICSAACVLACYGMSRLVSKHCIPSEISVQEAFLRFKETYPVASDTPLENIGTLTFLQALRL